VLLPARNRKDLEDVPDSVKRDMKFIFCERVDDLMREALGFEATLQFKVAS
jgi:ATP-dependent Lon protease